MCVCLYKMKIIILDTETSGLTGKDRIIEFGIIILDENLEQVYSGSDFCHIDFELSEETTKYNGIKNSNLKGAKKIKDTPSFKEFQKYNNKENIVVIHNAWFDMYMMYMSHIKVECRVLDTLNCARHVYPQQKSHSMLNLINHVVLKSDEKPEIQTHRVIDDCKMLTRLLKHLLINNNMLDLLFMSERVIIGFGKNKGKLWTEVDKNYIQWAHDKFLQKNSPEQIYVKTLLKMKLSKQEEKLAEYLHIN